MINAKQWIPFCYIFMIFWATTQAPLLFIYHLFFILYFLLKKTQLNWFENMAQHDRWHGTWSAVGRLHFSLGQVELFRCDMKHKACELIPLNESRIQWEKKGTRSNEANVLFFSQKTDFVRKKERSSLNNMRLGGDKANFIAIENHINFLIWNDSTPFTVQCSFGCWGLQFTDLYT